MRNFANTQLIAVTAMLLVGCLALGGTREVHAQSISALLVGKRVKVSITDGKILGTVKLVEGAQIYLTNAITNPFEPPGDVLIDTRSGGFRHLEVMPKREIKGKLQLLRFKLFGHTAASIRVAETNFWLDYSGNQEVIKKIASLEGKSVVVKGTHEPRFISIPADGEENPQPQYEQVIIVDSLEVGP